MFEHPGFARVFDFGYLRGHPCFTSEYIEGQSLLRTFSATGWIGAAPQVARRPDHGSPAVPSGCGAVAGEQAGSRARENSEGDLMRTVPLTHSSGSAR